jgi:hypothetical protein
MGSPMNPHESIDGRLILLRRLQRWRMAFLGVIILFGGAMSGAAATLLILRYVGQKGPLSPPFMVERMLERLDDRLHLTADQRRQAKPILLQHVQKLRGIWEEGRTAIRQELELLDRDMSQVLDKDQEQLWRQLHEPLVRPFRRGPMRRPLGPGGWTGLPDGSRGRAPIPDANTVPPK